MRRAAVLLVIGTVLAPARAAHSDVGADITATVATLPSCDTARAHCIGLHLHIPTAPANAGTDDELLATTDFLAVQLSDANRHFAALGVSFQVVAIENLPADAAHIATRDERNAVATGRLTGKAIHVFVTGQLDNIDEPNAFIRGVTWHTPNSDRKYVILSSVAPDRVLAHELGHVFGLPHSNYAISIMNKTDRAAPPPAQRTFADKEITKMRPVLKRLLRDHVIADVAR